jgi:alkylhydroperoxidase family enzyme
MARLRYLEGREAGLLARIVQALFRRQLGRELNPTKVIARVPRALLWSFLSNAIMGTGRWSIGRELAQLVRVRVAALNGCPF